MFPLCSANLNIMLVLYYLACEKNLTQVAKKLQISQAAVSQNLKKLREIYQDPLLIKDKNNKYILTQTLEELQPQLEDWFKKTSSLLAIKKKFSPQNEKVVFNIGVSDYAQYKFVPLIISHLQKECPDFEVNFIEMNQVIDPDSFEKGNLHLALGVYKSPPGHFYSTVIYEDNAVCVGNKNDHDFKKKLSLKKLADKKHILVKYYQKREEFVADKYFQEEGYKRDVVIQVPNALCALQLIAKMNYVCFLMKGVVDSFGDNFPIAWQELPFCAPKINIKMIWHEKYKSHSAHVWLRNLIKGIMPVI